MRKGFVFKFILIILIFININVFASVRTFERTEDNLRVNENINVNSSNIDDILNTPSVDEKEKVYDFANLFSDSKEIEIYNRINNYITATNYDFAVVTINENNKYDEVSYADDFYDYNNFGFDSSFSGLLLLIDMDNRVIYISTSGYCIKMYDDDRIDRIIDAGYDLLVDENYADCIICMINEALDFYHKGFPESNKNLIVEGTDVYYYEEKTIMDYLVLPLVFSLVITVIVAIIMYNKTRLKIKSLNSVSYLTHERDLKVIRQVIRSSVSRIPIDTGESSYEGSGRSSGGSSYHSSSSGRSHGGGGRRF